ncbi:MAG: acyl dehydratase [Propionibacteriales bacterium]|nr:acyl dehydratase [Propionibacteriales bacterium]
MTELSEAEALIGDDARAVIGHELNRTVGTVRRLEFQRWAAAVGDRNPLYFDAKYARAHGYRDVAAPPLYLAYIGASVVDLDQLRPDGLARQSGSGVVPLPKCPRRMAGGDDYTFHEPVYDGDVITTVRRLAELEPKAGRSGPFVLMRFHTTFTRDDGVLVGEVAGSLIARPAKGA